MPLLVIGLPEMLKMLGTLAATLVTVPAPAGVDQLPSPRQNVDALADVPELRFVTGKFPVTPLVSGRPLALVRTALAGVPRAGVTITGLCSVPTVVNEEAVTLEANVAPVRVPAGATTAAVVIAVVNPFS